MTKSIYYTYRVGFKPTGKGYYGVRTAAKCQPTDDLWSSYFTSSKDVKALIEEHGAESFITEIRKTFDTAEAACEWEHRVLRRLKVCSNPNWLNKSYGTAGLPIWNEARKKAQSERMMGNTIALGNTNTKGMKHSDESNAAKSKRMMGNTNARSNKGKKYTDEWKKAQSERISEWWVKRKSG